jgi:hypothetical protein
MSDFGKYPDHRYVAMFPLLVLKPFDDLVENMRQFGQLVPCVRYKGEVLDGRNRVRACIHLGIKPDFVEWRPPKPDEDVDTQILEFIVSMNLHRRQLEPGQRALVAADYYEKIKLPKGTRGGAGPSLRRAADLFGLGAGTVLDAVQLKRNGKPEAIAAVAAGELSLTRAFLEMEVSPAQTVDHQRLLNRRANLLRRWRLMLRTDAPKFPEFSEVWEAMRKRLNKLADFEASTAK